MTDRPALEQRLTGIAADLESVAMARTGGEISWATGGRAFAVLDAGAVDLRLDPAVAAAAARTPDVTLSARGSDWVRFAPTTLDQHAIDRLEAWFTFAQRHASSARTGSEAEPR